MAVTKTARTLQASISNAAGATKTGTGLDLTTALGLEVVGKITNGGTGPTIGCSFVLEISNNGTDWFEWFRGLGKTANDEVTNFLVNVPSEVMHVRSVFSGNTGQAVTVECVGHELTSI